MRTVDFFSTWTAIGLTSSLLALCFTFQSCRVTGFKSPAPTEQELARMDPMSLVETYWAAALRGDSETIKRITGPYPDSMIFECGKPEDLSPLKGEIANSAVTDGAEFPGADKPINMIESILRTANVLRIANQKLAEDFILTKQEYRGEATVTVRPKDSPGRYNTRIFFFLKDGEQWKLVDLRAEAGLEFLGNKKFGQPRECGSGVNGSDAGS